jgi:hypothetical protein
VSAPAEPDEAADTELDDLITRADLDGLVRLVDARATQGDWAGVARARHRARWAVGTGRQLWPVATLAEYRLALRAPPTWAASVLTEDAGRFTPGPLPEVAASTHTWAELAPHLPDGTGTPLAAVLAHERVLRGEDLRAVDDLRGDVFDVPYALQPWEPAYVLAAYTDDGLEAPAPPLPSTSAAELPAPSSGSVIDDADSSAAWRELVRAWTSGSNGRADVVAVAGDARSAIAALGIRRARLAALSPQEALAWLAWAGGNGGAHGRRPGAAAGRATAWWVVATLGDVTAGEPPATEQALHRLRWWWWDAFEPPAGWELRLAVEDPTEGLAWAVAATDSA